MLSDSTCLYAIRLNTIFSLSILRLGTFRNNFEERDEV